MQYRRLGDSDLVVSEIALGSWLTYGDKVTDEHAVDCVHAALDAGITLFDTANVYGRGAAEELLARAFTGIERDRYVLATKVYMPMGRGELGLSAAQVRKQCDASLRRLGTDYIDIYQCHRFDSTTPLAETMGALTELVEAGKVRVTGFSEWTPENIEAALAVPDVTPFRSSQPQYSMLWRRPETAVFPLCAAHGIGQIVYSPLAQGALSGKYRAGEPPPATSRAAGRGTASAMRAFSAEPVRAAVDRLRPLAGAAGLSMPQLALAWVLRRSEVAAAIVGATRPEQIWQNVTASGVTLAPDLIAEIDAVLASAVVG
ncbi:aldo/keto reductase family protein [Micromonospora sp. FIMYZ51]|uniref:aldo/keto reductase family protein n=1 Tax=Micromonospora sp. FIMYZ51 TaxID=3051832 RepID=UPI00311D7A85